jgi:hypothetical protein
MIGFYKKHNIDFLTKVVLPKFLIEHTPILTEYEYMILNSTVECKNCEMKKDIFGFGGDKELFTEFWKFVLVLSGILTKMVVHSSKEEFVDFLYELFKNDNDTELPELRKCILAIKDRIVAGEEKVQNLYYEHGLLIVRKLRKILRSGHRKNNKIFRKMCKNEIEYLFEKIPENLKKFYVFRQYGEKNADN